MNGSKRLFLALSFVSLAILGSGVMLFFWLVMPRLQMLSEWMFYAAGAAAALFLLVVSGGLFLLFLSAITERDFLFPHGKKQVTVKVLYPINLFLGFLLGIGRERVGESFVEFNNALVRATRKRIDPGRMMILLPHCLQLSDCQYRVTSDIGNCRRCGKCAISKLAELSEKINARIAVATGGTLARRLIVEIKPTLILAVACERDLVSGILDAYPIPVYGILNQRPHGPCNNTTVDMEKVKAGFVSLLGKEI
ncbi:MAG: hypothetical protein A2509_04505 [Candidatus Edwardsbacteria bacterium RIFOXYD12_FULL_50_11]|jgi:hypothetical protein|uniref:DUF116 domain-containing protein n=1 Tax=Candidatus Edwardsbacteria bacterium GWF2_54_11 TaxID=1817851 RepID=A0A1F5REV5_9BACT|nr:MAG: hypothetical protein A2502_05710 [Candidatus Edwardsbacteria bacterium RifOxyC12_full_54_24]OGF07945.1 MAG: hypothetical protein A2273_05665 [Candidatus Edwardsbacteria bacterium RifOxyA12_full_54_48]OGF10193.1 MAG: hypothetical protein A3K15_12080 [Candidatus Edwardsbacteria bacterium GWE2_54_12]OGF12986.1 MAG: hypothetical protein A2024_01800 [Candidatus Edwardsbacteria bacterium GWF2_54_11]OGF15105.1 MAG: hypothetical protein A2509_04505 [Candidatus Edwardsbacteria bacterium RIFOXYD1